MPLTVVGGTYLEFCLYPQRYQLFGSGGRAAAVVAQLSGRRPVLHTWFDPNHREDLKRLAIEYRFESADPWPSKRVAFHYFHGMSPVATTPPRWLLPKKQAGPLKAKHALVFGTLEGDVFVEASEAVFDPQAGEAARPPLATGLKGKRIAIVCNRTEAFAISGSRDLLAAGRRLLRLPGVEAAVVKADASGALVFTRSGVTAIGCIRTQRVFPIGSGDVFSAAFSFYWLVRRRTAVDAARLAAAGVASYCERGDFHELSVKNAPRAPVIAPRRLLAAPKRVYLAGPFFDMGQRWLIGQAYDALRAVGLRVFSPVHDVGHPKNKALIAAKDLAGLRACDVVYAVVSGMDPGTVFEIGYATQRRIPVVMFGSNLREEDLTMLVGTGASLERDFATSIYKARWAADG